MYQGHKIIITICARGGSKGVPKKNIRPLLGKPLLAYTIEQVKALSWVDRIVVSTDDPEIREIATKWGIEVPFLRPKYLATDTAAKIPVIIHAIRKAQSYWHETFDINIDMDVTSPLRKTSDIKNALKLLINTPYTKAVFSVYPASRSPYFNMVEPDKDGYVHLSKMLKNPILRRQDSPIVYAMNASIYVMRVKDLLKEKSYHTNQTRAYLMPEERSIDIDKPLDFEFVEFLMRKRV